MTVLAVTCRTPDCRRTPHRDSVWCDPCLDALLWGHVRPGQPALGGHDGARPRVVARSDYVLEPVHPGPIRVRGERTLPSLAESAWRAVALLELVAIVAIVVLWPR
ncbi:MAG: hypothetical protein M0T75_09140 [Chloroflexi bacterium]|nr:hypothetical protein [Chloroflexota bacterium]